jgi:hypothetical protein
MARNGRGSDWLGDASDESFLSHGVLPRKKRDVKLAAVKTADDAKEYARRFFHGAVDSAAKLPKTLAAVRARWALAAKQYKLAHDMAAEGAPLALVVQGLNAADLNSATAIVAAKVDDRGQRGTLAPATVWPTAAAPAPLPSAPPKAPGSSPAPPAPRPAPDPDAIVDRVVEGVLGPLPEGPAPAPAPRAPGPASPASPGVVAGAIEPAPGTVPAEWLKSSLLPAATKRVKLEDVRTLADAQQYARRFFHGAVEHGNETSNAGIKQRWAEAARIYVYAHRLAADPFIDRALDAVLNDLRAADILSAQAIAAEKGGQLAPIVIQWFTSRELAERALATFKLTGAVLPGETSSSSSSSSPPSSGAQGGASPASLESPARLPRTFDAIIDRFRGPVPRAYVRALIMAESGFNPNEVNESSGARGLLQVTAIVLEDWNRSHPTEQHTTAQLLDPVVNLKLGLGTLTRIVASYSRNHPSTALMNFRSTRYAEILAEAWNVGYSETAGVGLILSAFERDGTPATLSNIVERGPAVAGLPERVAKRIRDRGTQFPVRVRQLYFGELERGEGIGQPLTAGGLSEEAAAVAFMGALLFGDEVFGK